MAKVYLVNRGQHAAMLAEKFLEPGAGRIVPEQAARVAMASYDGLEILSAEDAPVYRWCKVLAGPVPWQGGQLQQGSRAWFDDNSFRRYRERLEVEHTALDD